MSSSRRILVASVSRSTELLVERAVQNAGFTVHTVAPLPDAIKNALGDGTGGVVVLDALQQGVGAVDCVRTVISSHPNARIIVLGSRPDLGVVSRFVRAGASNYLLPYVGATEFLKAVDDADSGRSAAADTLFGRVRACLPASKEADGRYVMPDGSQLGLADVITQCVSVGLTTEEIAECVGVTVAALATLGKARGSGASSGNGVMTQLGDFVRGIVAQGSDSTGSSRSSSREGCGVLRPELKILGVFVIAVCGLWWLLTERRPAIYGTTGTVSYQGQPVAVGEIVFEPQSERGQRRTALVKDGRFELPKREGFPLGQSYLVRVYGYRETGEKYENADMSQSAVIQEQFLPTRYNQATELTFETTSQNLRAGLPLDLQ